MNTRITARDFFLHLGAIVTFYASTIALVTLLFEVINYAYPKITGAYGYYLPSISFQVATLIVAFPLFLFLSWLLQKSYASEPALRDAPIRKFLAFITLFIAGAIAAGDLVAVIYTFLDGQELTTGFLLKFLALIVVMGGIFAYYLREIKNLIGSKERNIWRVAAAVLVLGSIILGFAVIGSPIAQREYRYDIQKTTDLQNIQWQIINYWQAKESLPANLDTLNDPIKGGYLPKDPQTGENYEYNKKSALTFELCAVFNRESRLVRADGYYGGGVPMMERSVYMGPEAENWTHEAGRQCFTRTIDPELYPKYPR